MLKNGLLLRTASEAEFEVFISIDKKLEHEQNLNALPLPIVVLDAPSNRLADLIPFTNSLKLLLESPLECSLYVVNAAGTVRRLPDS